MKKLATLLLLFLSVFAQAQNEFNVIPPSPNAGQLGKFGEIPVNYSTGSVNVTIPIYIIKEGTINWPIALNYNYNGYKPDESPGWVGTGFTLNAGGIITRTVQGLHDEIPTYGFFDKALEVETAMNSQLNGQYSNAAAMLTQLQQGLFDSEPDMFHFNFGGYSGKFFFGQDGEPHIVTNRKIKIEKIMANQAFQDNGRTYVHIIKSFKLTTEDGTQYFFDVREYTRSEFSTSSSSFLAPSAWHLSEMITVTGEKLIFNYTTQTTVYNQSIVEKGIGSSCYPCNNGLLSFESGFSYTISEERFLSSIEVENGFTRILFPSEVFSYVGGPGNVYTSVSRRLNEIRVENIVTNDIIQKTKLDYHSNFKFALIKVEQENDTGLKLKPYLLEYSGLSAYTPFYPTNNFIDFWGYFNLAYNNPSTIPAFGANRFPNEANVWNLLSKIIYPTGGYSKFEYELNDFSFTSDGPITDSLIITEDYNYQYRGWDAIHFDQDPVLTVDYPSFYTVTFSCVHSPYNPASSGCPAQGTPCSLNGNFTTGTLLPNNSYDGNYFITSTMLQNIQCISELVVTAKVTLYRVLPSNKQNGPGFRIKKISSSPDIASNETIKTYDYSDPNDTSKSSGGLNRVPVFSGIASFWAYGGITDFFYYKNAPLFTIGSPIVLYSNVVETINNSYKNVYSYTSYKELYLDINQIVAPGYEGIGLEPIGTVENYDFSRGVLLSKTNFNDQNLKKSQTENSFFYRHEEGAGLQNTKEYKTVSLYYEYLVTIPANGPSGSPSNIYFTKYYYTLGSFFEKSLEINKTYDELGLNPVINSTNYFYDNLNHLQLTKTRTGKSNGDTLETVIKYPQDYQDALGTSKAGFIQNLLDENRHGIPLETVTYLEKAPNDRKVISAEVTTFKQFTGNTNKPQLTMPYKKFVLSDFNSFTAYNGLTDDISSNSYLEVLKFEDYNSHGNIRSILKNKNEKMSYLWAYKGMYPVAEISNANWTETNAVLPSGETNLLNDTNSTSIEGKLNNIRTSLGNSLVNGYIHKPMIGISKTIAPNGLNSYYTYDSFNRLMEIKDHNQNIIKRYDYHFANQ